MFQVSLKYVLPAYKVLAAICLTKENDRMLYAAVDLGSNSFRLHIAESCHGTLHILKSARDPVRLGAGLDQNGFLTDAAQKTALDSLFRFKEILAPYSLDAVRIVATNTLRIAKNSTSFITEAENVVGYPIEVISGEEEGRLIYMGVASATATPNERRLVIDIGGGSTEVILGSGQEIQRVESFSIGTARQVQAFFSSGRIDSESFEAAVLSAKAQFEDGIQAFHPRSWAVAYGSSGTIRCISEAIAKNRIGDGLMSYESLQVLKNHLIRSGHFGNFLLSGIKPERIPAMTGGLTILLGLMQEIGFDSLEAVDAGLRMGVLHDLQLRASDQDRREQATWELMNRFGTDQERALKTADIALTLYEQLQEKGNYDLYLRWSALLHEVGLAVSHTGYHKHGAYIVEHADIAGFTTREQQIMGRLILAQKGNLQKVEHWLKDVDFSRALLALRLAILFMHAHTELDFSKLRIKMKNRVEIEAGKKSVLHQSSVSCWLEKEANYWADMGIPFVVRKD